MPAVPEMAADLQTALSHTAKLLETSPILAAEQAQEILKTVPDQANALMFFAWPNTGWAIRRAPLIA